ncbi:MAG TPA: DUF6498-containing protein [Thermoanaerobaculia bacterium]|nr:DUF6498-containing protein [Thermoanaerobaculia bacterium]
MNRLGRLTQLIGINSVPVAGVMFDGWSNATALALYWCETVLFVILVFVRIHLHRLATKKRGHYLEVKVKSVSNGRTRNDSKIGYFATTFLIFALIFSFAEVVFLKFALGDDIETINKTNLLHGVIAAAIFLVIGFAMDMAGLRERPFSWIRNMSMGALWRVFLVQLAIIAGVVGTGFFGLPRVTLISFVFLKLWTDAASQLPVYDPEEAPQWMRGVMGKGFAEFWRADKAKEHEREAAEEEKFNGIPMPFEQSLIQRTDG